MHSIDEYLPGPEAAPPIAGAGPAGLPRILFLASSSNHYGSERALTELIHELRLLGAEAAVVAPADGPLVEELGRAGVVTSIQPLTIIGRSMTPRQVLGGARAIVRPHPGLLRVAREFNPTVVYSNTSHIVDGPALARASSVPHVWHLREIERVPDPVRRAFGLWLVMTGRRVLAISRPVRDATFGDRFRRPTVVPDGIDLAHYSSGVPYVAPDGFDEERPLRVLCAARITRWKGQHVAVSAVAQLTRRARPVVLRVVGDPFTGADEVYFAELVASAGTIPNGSVSITPGVRDVRPLLAWSDVLVHTSIAPEPFGRTVVEAMAFPRAVVATALGGPVDVLADDVGIFVPPADADALASVLDRLIDTPGLIERHAARGHARAQEFSATDCARQVHEILRGLGRDS